ncbi:carbonic anhydrase [Streptomyces sp. BI20]|uniref:carbonic anhydrase n=1 Tax=Streptomyces sp. BI20 TaxID=3403460 RepID=UPI003C777C19
MNTRTRRNLFGLVGLAGWAAGAVVASALIPASVPLPGAGTGRAGALTALGARGTPGAPRPAGLDGKAGAPDPGTGAGTALRLLREGNERYATGRQRHPHEDGPRRRALAGGPQRPFAVVLGCVDSRVPPEHVFDVGLGDLVCVRTAGHAVDEAVLGSVEFGITELGAPLVVVLGHERCGAVSAAVARVRDGTRVGGHTGRVVEALAPAARAARGTDGEGDGDGEGWVDRAVRENVDRTCARLRADRGFAGARVVGARFDLDTGRVTFTG